MDSGSDSRTGDHKPEKARVLRDSYEDGKLWEFCATPRKMFDKQNTSFSLVKYLRNKTRSCGLWRWSQCIGDFVILLEFMWNDA